MNPKPFVNCNGCKKYLDNCHCLCHNSIDAPGYHEIVYGTLEISKNSIHPTAEEWAEM